jgi:hypothetical protein
MPARRKQNRKTKKGSKRKIAKLLTATFIVIAFFSIFNFIFSGGEWDGSSKVNIVVNGDEDIIVTTFDPEKREMVSVKIPSDTEVEVARNMGRWRLGSVWDLGVNEGIEGLLLAETVTRYFHLPVYLYIDEGGKGLFESNLLSAFKVLFYPGRSNVHKKDLISIVQFTSSVKNPDRRVIDLIDTNSLQGVELKGGGMGYKKTRDISQSIIAPFSNEDIANNLTIVKIVNNSDNRLVSSKLGRVIEATGAKVAQVVSNEEKEGDCLVKSEDEQVGKYYSKLFSCEYKNTSGENFDVVIMINKDFIKRY